MSVRKRQGSQFYRYDFLLYGDRYQGSTKCTSEREADKYVTTLKSQLMHGRIGIQKGPKSTATLKEFRKKFLDHCKGTVDPETYEYYRSKFDCGPLAWKPLAEAELADIDEDLIDKFVLSCRKRVGLRTTNHYLRTLRKALKLAKRWKLIDRAPDVRLLAGEQSKDYRPTAEDKSAYLERAAKRFPRSARCRRAWLRGGTASEGIALPEARRRASESGGIENRLHSFPVRRQRSVQPVRATDRCCAGDAGEAYVGTGQAEGEAQDEVAISFPAKRCEPDRAQDHRRRTPDGKKGTRNGREVHSAYLAA